VNSQQFVSISQEWIFNFVRQLHQCPSHQKEFLAIGTTGNEQIHRELNNAFDLVHSMHRSVLTLKLRIFHFYKLWPHACAMGSDGSRQLSHKLLLSRLSMTWRPWSSDAWAEHCYVNMTETGGVGCAPLPLTRQRQADARRVRLWAVQKRPARSKCMQARKRTAYTRATGLRKLRQDKVLERSERVSIA